MIPKRASFWQGLILAKGLLERLLIRADRLQIVNFCQGISHPCSPQILIESISV